jgi:hypothetical protein
MSKSGQGANAYRTLGDLQKTNITRTDHSSRTFIGCFNDLRLICIDLCLRKKIQNLARPKSAKTSKRVAAPVLLTSQMLLSLSKSDGQPTLSQSFNNSSSMTDPLRRVRTLVAIDIRVRLTSLSITSVAAVPTPRVPDGLLQFGFQPPVSRTGLSRVF